MDSILKRVLLSAIAVALLPNILCLERAEAQNSTAHKQTWVTNGEVNAIVRKAGTVYLGGSFTHVGPNTGNGAPIDMTSGLADPNFAHVDGKILVSVTDGVGGWYIGGEFTQVGLLARNRIAHILADGTVNTAWNPEANGDVTALTVSGSTVYVGGLFTTIGGETRNYIAALDTATGLATAWNPDASGGAFPGTSVEALAVDGTTVYAGGNFTAIGGEPRNYIAALDASATGTATAWNPDPNGTVWSFAIDGATIYVGGDFVSIGGETRDHIAALDTSTGAATPWDPGAINPLTRTFAPIFDLKVVGGTVYAAGRFVNIGGENRRGLAALDAVTGLATDWNPRAIKDTLLMNIASVYALAIDGGTVYAGGDFTELGGEFRNMLAAIDISTGLATAWDPDPSGGIAILSNVDSVQTLAVSGTKVFAGGNFVTIGGVTRNGLAALDAATGIANDWNPDTKISITPGAPSGLVSALAVSPGMVYVGGIFAAIGGQPRNHIAALDAATGLATDWNPDASGRGVGGVVLALSLSEGVVYAGENFTSMGGQTRNGVAAIYTASGDVTPWNPDVLQIFRPGSVSAIAVDGDTVYIGGRFTTVGELTRESIAAISATTGNSTTWNPDPKGFDGRAGGPILALAVDGSTVYAGGNFFEIGGQPRSGIAALEAATGNATDWNPGIIVTVEAIALSGSTVYAGGFITKVGEEARNGIVALDADSTDTLTAWNPEIPDNQGAVHAIAVSGTTVFVGGEFRTIGGTRREAFAKFSSLSAPIPILDYLLGHIKVPDQPEPFNRNTDNQVNIADIITNLYE